MARVLHDLLCSRCEKVEECFVTPGDYPPCSCGGARTWMPSRLQTDLWSTPAYSIASGRCHSSQREKERYMRDRGWECTGDPVGGARPELRIRGTTFSFGSDLTGRSGSSRGAAANSGRAHERNRS